MHTPPGNQLAPRPPPSLPPSCCVQLQRVLARDFILAARMPHSKLFEQDGHDNNFLVGLRGGLCGGCVEGQGTKQRSMLRLDMCQASHAHSRCSGGLAQLRTRRIVMC